MLTPNLEDACPILYFDCPHRVMMFKLSACPLTFVGYRQTSNIIHTPVVNKIADHSDVVGASPVGAAPTTSSFLTKHLASMDCTKKTAKRDGKHLSFGIWCDLC